MSEKTSLGMDAQNVGRAWGGFVVIPGNDGNPYKMESKRDGPPDGVVSDLEGVVQEKFVVYVSDDPRTDPYTHPWLWVVSWILSGGYTERRYARGSDGRWRLVGVFTHRAGDRVRVGVNEAHVVYDVLPGTTTHMCISALAAGAQNWGHLTKCSGGEGDGGGIWKYIPVEQAPEFREKFARLNTRPV